VIFNWVALSNVELFNRLTLIEEQRKLWEQIDSRAKELVSFVWNIDFPIKRKRGNMYVRYHKLKSYRDKDN
jgi:hypothetical protein